MNRQPHHDDRVCIVSTTVLDGNPIAHVLHDRPANRADSGYVVLGDDVTLDADGIPEPPDNMNALHVLCLHCLLDTHPEAGPALEHAKQTGHWTR